MEFNNEVCIVWEKFLRKYYLEEILSLARYYPDIKSIKLDFRKISIFDYTLANELLDNPEYHLLHIEHTIKNMEITTVVEFNKIYVNIKNLLDITPIKSLRSAHIDTLVRLNGLVTKVTPVRPQIKTAAFECSACHDYTFVEQEGLNHIKPHICSNQACGRSSKFILIPKESTFVDYQKVRIQESPDNMRGHEQPHSLDVNLYDDHTGTIKPGDKINIVGILKSYQRKTQHGESNIFDIELIANSYEIEQKGFEDITMTTADITKIRKLSRDPKIYSKIVASIAPSIYGFEEVKMAVALQLFGGVAKTMCDGLPARADIHILLVGDPGIAKSQILRFMNNVAPIAVMASGKNASGPGLTATAIKDDDFGGKGQWTLEAGALVLADYGLACIDEFDKMNNSDRDSMHEAMEQQYIPIAKAGINTKLNSRCTVLAAANPRDGRFDPDEAIGKQVNISSALLSRFDLIFILKDTPDPVRDEKLARHILASHAAATINKQFHTSSDNNETTTGSKVSDLIDEINHEETNYEGHTIENTDANINTTNQFNSTPVLSNDLLRKYIAYAKKNINPICPKDVEDKLTEYYLSMRSQWKPSHTPLPITARSITALIRLAEASAKLRLSNTISKDDAERVITIINSTLEQVYRDPETGQLDVDRIGTVDNSLRTKIKHVRKAIGELSAKSDAKSAEYNDIANSLSDKIKLEEVREILEQLKRRGEIYEISSNKYRVA